MVGYPLIERDSLGELVKFGIEIRGILVALVRSPRHDIWVKRVVNGVMSHLRSSILFCIPVSSPQEAIAGPCQILSFLQVDLSNLLLPIGSLSESTTGNEVLDCLLKGLNGHCRNLRYISSHAAGMKDLQSGNPRLYALAAFHHALPASRDSLHFSLHSASRAKQSPDSLNCFSSLKALAAC